MFKGCEADYGAGNCEESGLVVYPKCKPGFHAVGCCICSPDCPAGMKLMVGVQVQLVLNVQKTKKKMHSHAMLNVKAVFVE